MIIHGGISYSHYVITIKKISGLVILTIFLLPAVFAENGMGGYAFSLSPNIGILYGQAEEIVYKEPPHQNNYLSELLWDLKPLVYVGLGLGFRPLDPLGRQGFIAALSLKAGLPIRTGIIEDRDWENPNEGYLTRFSRHDAYSRTAILLDASAGYFWRFADPLAFSVYGEFSYMHFSWSARDGYTQYPPGAGNPPWPAWDSTIGKRPSNGELLRYRQDWFVFSPGVSLDWNINQLFSLKAHFNYSPLIYCSDRDDHLLGNSTYLDYLYFGHYIKFGGEFTLSPSQKTGISIFVSYKRITDARGDTLYQSRRYEDEAGAGYSALDLGLAVKFYL